MECKPDKKKYTYLKNDVEIGLKLIYLYIF